MGLGLSKALEIVGLRSHLESLGYKGKRRGNHQPVGYVTRTIFTSQGYVRRIRERSSRDHAPDVWYDIKVAYFAKTFVWILGLLNQKSLEHIFFRRLYCCIVVCRVPDSIYSFEFIPGTRL